MAWSLSILGENTVQKIIIFSDSQNIKPTHITTHFERIFFFEQEAFLKQKNIKKCVTMKKSESKCGTTKFLVLF